MDEVHRIKNPKTKGYKALVPLPSFRRLGLTGTPMQNNLMELFYVLDQVSPGCAGEAGDFKIKYAANVKHHHDRTPLEALEAEGAIKELQLAIIKPNILMRKKSNVLAHLLPTKTELAVLCKMGTIQEKVYQRATSYVDFRYVSMCAHHRKQEKGAYFEQPGTIWAQQNRHRDENTPGVLKACDKCPGCMLFSMIHICMKLAVSTSNFNFDTAVSQRLQLVDIPPIRYQIYLCAPRHSVSDYRSLSMFYVVYYLFTSFPFARSHLLYFFAQ